MHSGKWGLTRPSMDLAVMAAPVMFGVVSYSCWVKPVDRWLRMGTKRSSSSNLGNACAVIRKAASSRDVNSARTREICSVIGAYAFPAFKNALRVSTRFTTFSQSALKKGPSSPLIPVAAASCGPSTRTSSLLTGSQVKFKESINFSRSSRSSDTQRMRKRARSAREKRTRSSSVREKARRRIKWE